MTEKNGDPRLERENISYLLHRPSSSRLSPAASPSTTTTGEPPSSPTFTTDPHHSDPAQRTFTPADLQADIHSFDSSFLFHSITILPSFFTAFVLSPCLSFTIIIFFSTEPPSPPFHHCLTSQKLTAFSHLSLLVYFVICFNGHFGWAIDLRGYVCLILDFLEMRM